LLLHVLDEALCLCRIGHIRLHGDPADLAGDLLGRLLAGAVVDRNLRAGLPELAADRRADATRAPGDEGDLAFE
jgi:hypothetical protein